MIATIHRFHKRKLLLDIFSFIFFFSSTLRTSRQIQEAGKWRLIESLEKKNRFSYSSTVRRLVLKWWIGGTWRSRVGSLLFLCFVVCFINKNFCLKKSSISFKLSHWWWKAFPRSSWLQEECPREMRSFDVEHL